MRGNKFTQKDLRAMFLQILMHLMGMGLKESTFRETSKTLLLYIP